MTSRPPTGLPDAQTFLWGTATASYQVEGATTADGRGPSIWDTFAALPGTVRDGKDGSVACDSYHRLDEDLALLDRLGVDAYRFSVAWPRVVPQGVGNVEGRGLDYYDRVVDGLLERGITPMVTLYHWDLPQALESRGGWLNRDTAEAFADYAMVVTERLADRVGLWATHNEPWCAALLGYAAGVHAPGRTEGTRALVAAHHLNLGHALAAHRMREAGAGDVGIVHNLNTVWPERPEAADVADGVDAIRNRVWIDPLVDGAYDERLRAIAPELADPDVVREGDLDLIRGSADWIGVNYYTPDRPDVLDEGEVDAGAAAAYPGVEGLTFRPRGPLTDIGWETDDRALTELLVATHERTGLPLLVTENGAACVDAVADDCRVDDQDRITYLRDHLAALERAREQGADVRGYVCWTLLDNFEWAEGYTKTFGLVHIDPETQDRTPKASFDFYADHVARHR
ncbi:beta-glucosidase [Nocardioides sp. HDW12B]|uniref:GH1 family beta-glucosidase n=1 Tax=Nocardioides sp. HDW12B TaxID=2714939 RepID=UPI001407557F|nr:GH1 family beta-glucosidase [Nocardioides sp. HDW12B]QIK67565.1 beta-glucosidase [Nocardioides sp. HDW12B]